MPCLAAIGYWCFGSVSQHVVAELETRALFAGRLRWRSLRRLLVVAQGPMAVQKAWEDSFSDRGWCYACASVRLAAYESD